MNLGMRLRYHVALLALIELARRLTHRPNTGAATERGIIQWHLDDIEMAEYFARVL